jgi:hypothetical protein
LRLLITQPSNIYSGRTYRLAGSYRSWELSTRYDCIRETRRDFSLATP